MSRKKAFGTEPNQAPKNRDLGSAAYFDVPVLAEHLRRKELGNFASAKYVISPDDPVGGMDGDFWFKYEE